MSRVDIKMPGWAAKTRFVTTQKSFTVYVNGAGIVPRTSRVANLQAWRATKINRAHITCARPQIWMRYFSGTLCDLISPHPRPAGNRQLEYKPRSKLKLPRPVGLGVDDTEAGAGRLQVRSTKRGMVQEVEGLQAQLYVYPLGHGESLDNRSIQVVRSILPQITEGRGQGTEMKLELVVRQRREMRRIEGGPNRLPVVQK